MLNQLRRLSDWLQACRSEAALLHHKAGL